MYELEFGYNIVTVTFLTLILSLEFTFNNIICSVLKLLLIDGLININSGLIVSPIVKFVVIL